MNNDEKNIPDDNNYFDIAMKARLENLDSLIPKPSLNDWEKIEKNLEKLDSDAVQLDQTVFEQIEKLAFAPTAKNWEAMSNLLDEAEKKDEAFDALFSQRLQSVSREFRPSHWNKFEPLIDFWLRFQMQLKRYRVLEVAILLLTIFPVLELFDAQRRNYLDRNNPPMVSSENTSENSNPLRRSTDKTFSSSSENKTLGENSMVWRDVERVINNLFSKSEKEKTNSEPENVAQIEQNRFSKGVNSSENVNTISQAFISKNTFVDNSQSEKSALQTVENQMWIDFNAKAIDVLPVPNVKPTKIIVAGLTKTPRSQFRVGVMSAVNQDFVQSNYLLNGETKSVNDAMVSWSTGATFSLKRGKTEFETGLIYSKRFYNPASIEHITGSFDKGYVSERFEDITVHTLSIPINVKQTVYQKAKWRVYVMGGATVNAVIGIKENKFVLDQSSNKITSAPPTALYSTEPDKLELPSYTRANTNHPNVTLDAGVGIEYQLGKKTVLYAQPVFKYHISNNGIGTLNDKINTMAFEVGVKTSL